MNRGEDQLESNLRTGADEAVQSLDQQVFQALLFSSFLNQQGNARGKLSLGARLKGILGLLKNLAKPMDAAQALNVAAACAVEVTGATGAAIALSRGGEMVCEATSGATAPDLGVSFSLESGLSGECVRTGRTLLCDDTENDERVNRQGARSLCVRSMMLAPINQPGDVLGVLEIFAAQPRSFGPDDITTLEIIAEIVSAYLVHSRERELRRALEAERSGVLNVLENLTPALEENIPERPALLTSSHHGPSRESSLRLTRGLDLLRTSRKVPPPERQ
jgi:GAF domain-containing protein